LNLIQEPENIPCEEVAFMEFLGWNPFDPDIQKSQNQNPLI